MSNPNENPNIQIFISLFSSSLSQNPEERENASSEIEHILNESLDEFILTCKDILDQYNSLDTLIVTQAILYLGKAFSPKTNVEKVSKIWRELWKIGDKEDDGNLILRNSIKGICLDLLRNENEVIRELSSQCLAYISIYDKAHFGKDFRSIVGIIADSSEAMEVRLASLITIKYFFEYYPKYNKREFVRVYVITFDELMDFSIHTLSNFESYDERFIVELIEMLSYFTYISTNHFSLDFLYLVPKGQENLDSLFQCIFDILQQTTENENIFRAVHIFFYSLFERVYECSCEFIGDKQELYENMPEGDVEEDQEDQEENQEEQNTKIIFYKEKNRIKLAHNKLQMLFDDHINQINFQSILPSTPVSYIAIDFWNMIGKYEKKIFKKNLLIDKFENISSDLKLNIHCNLTKSPNLLVFDQYRDQLLPMLLESMEFIDPNNDSFENPDDFESEFTYPCSYAASAVRKFFYFNPELTFQYISDYFEQTMNQTEVPWNVRHAQMQLISCVTILNNHKTHQPIFEFLESMSNMMIQSIFDYKDNNIVLVATLSAFTDAFRNYKLFMDPEPLTQLLDNICNLCNETRSQTVVQNCIETVREIINCFSKVDLDKQIDVIVPFVKDLISIITGRPDFSNSQYFQDLYSLKELLAGHVNPTNNHEIIEEIMSSSFEICKQTHNLNEFFGELHVFSYIMEEYGEQFIDEGIAISNRIFELLNGNNPTAAEECLVCLIKIISGLGENSEPLIDQLKDEVLNAFQSQSPGIIINVNRVLGSLFSKTGPMVYDLIESSVDFIISQIEAARSESEFSIYFTHQIHYLIFPLAQILESITYQEEICMAHRDRIFDAFYNYLLSPDQNENEEDSYLEAMILGFTAVVKAYANDILFLKKNKNKIFKISGILYDLTSMPDKVLFAYCDFVGTSFDIMKDDFILRRKFKSTEVIKPLIWAQCSLNNVLQEAARALISTIS